MKFYFKKKAFSLDNNTLCIADEAGNKKYDLKTSIMITKTIRILDEDKQEVAVIKQELKSLMPKYSVYVHDEKIMEVKKVFPPLIPKYEITGLGWQMNSRLMRHDYDILKDGNPVLTVSNHMLGSFHTCQIEIFNPRDELNALAVATAIDLGIEGESLTKE